MRGVQIQKVDRELNRIRSAAAFCLILFGVEEAIRTPHKLSALLFSAAGIASLFNKSRHKGELVQTGGAALRTALFWLVVLAAGVLAWYMVKAP